MIQDGDDAILTHTGQYRLGWIRTRVGHAITDHYRQGGSVPLSGTTAEPVIDFHPEDRAAAGVQMGDQIAVVETDVDHRTGTLVE
jgi:hypothetical protein